ncbi:MAG: transposase [Pseudomonadota bacterium]
MRQLGLAFSAPRGETPRSVRGGARIGAGRKPRSVAERSTPHRARAQPQARHPLHVTLRTAVRSLRKQQIIQTVLGALRDSQRQGFRIAHYSVQANHLHLIVEAESKTVLSSAMRGLAIRVSLRVNRLLFRRGRLWADRWHSHTLKTPREVPNALRYVLQNHRKHGSWSSRLDPLSSAQWFNGFAQPLPATFQSIGPPCIASPKTWLLSVGWRRHGLIEI